MDLVVRIQHPCPDNHSKETQLVQVPIQGLANYLDVASPIPLYAPNWATKRALYMASTGGPVITTALKRMSA